MTGKMLKKNATTNLLDLLPDDEDYDLDEEREEFENGLGDAGVAPIVYLANLSHEEQQQASKSNSSTSMEEDSGNIDSRGLLSLAETSSNGSWSSRLPLLGHRQKSKNYNTNINYSNSTSSKKFHMKVDEKETDYNFYGSCWKLVFIFIRSSPGCFLSSEDKPGTTQLLLERTRSFQQF